MRKLRTVIFAGVVMIAGCDAITMHGGGAVAQTAEAQADSTAQTQRYSVDTTLGDLTQNAAARAVVARYLPNVMEGPHAAMAAGYTPRQIQAQMPNMLTQTQLEQMDRDLAAIN